MHGYTCVRKKNSFSVLYPSCTCYTRNGFETSDDEQLILRAHLLVYFPTSEKGSKTRFRNVLF